MIRWLTAALLFGAACELPPVAELERQASCTVEDGTLEPHAPRMQRGFDAYYLQEETTRALRAGQPTDVLDEVLEKAAALEIRIVRTWAFNDGTGDAAIQTSPLVYDEVALQALDAVMAGAHARGISLVLTLANYWNDYGGVRRYVEWAGLPSPHEGDDRFFTDPAIRTHYRQHIQTLMRRINTVDGKRWADHPAVAYWELINEPRTRDDLLQPWFAEMAAALRQVEPTIRISSGQEGFSHQLSGLDTESMHLFPESWAWGRLQTATQGRQFIVDHAMRARAADRPLLFGELGLRNHGDFDLDERRALYRGWLRCAEAQGVTAALVWMFANDARPDAWDAHTFYYRDGTMPGDPVNRYADLLSP